MLLAIEICLTAIAIALAYVAPGLGTSGSRNGSGAAAILPAGESWLCFQWAFWH